MACMKTDGSLEMKSQKKVSAIPRTKYDNDAQAKARAMAALPPNISPNRPYTGPPHSCTMAKVVWRYPKNTGSTPSFFVKYWKIKQGRLHKGNVIIATLFYTWDFLNVLFFFHLVKNLKCMDCFVNVSGDSNCYICCLIIPMQIHIETSAAALFWLPSAKDSDILVRHCKTVYLRNIVTASIWLCYLVKVRVFS